MYHFEKFGKKNSLNLQINNHKISKIFIIEKVNLVYLSILFSFKNSSFLYFKQNFFGRDRFLGQKTVPPVSQQNHDESQPLSNLAHTRGER